MTCRNLPMQISKRFTRNLFMNLWEKKKNLSLMRKKYFQLCFGWYSVDNLWDILSAASSGKRWKYFLLWLGILLLIYTVIFYDVIKNVGGKNESDVLDFSIPVQWHFVYISFHLNRLSFTRKRRLASLVLHDIWDVFIVTYKLVNVWLWEICAHLPYFLD